MDLTGLLAPAFNIPVIIVLILFSWFLRRPNIAFMAAVMQIPGSLYWALIPEFYYLTPVLPVFIWLGAWQLFLRRSNLSMGFFIIYFLLAGFVLFKAMMF